MCTLQGEALKLGFARFKTSADGLDLFFIAELSACGRDGIWPASRENPSYRRQERKELFHDSGQLVPLLRQQP